jgi:hypothetical protein
LGHRWRRIGADKTGNRLANAEVVDAFEGGAAGAADNGVAVAADKRVGDGFGADGAVEFGFRHGYLAGAIWSTLRVLPLSVPVTVTF